MLVGIDIDGVIRDWWGSVKTVFKKIYPEIELPENPEEYDIGCITPLGGTIYRLIFDYLADDIYINAQPYPGAIEFLDKIKREHNIVFLSNQFTDKLRRLTDIWLMKNKLDDIKREYTAEKEKYPGLNALIDDCTDNLIHAKLNNILAIAIDRQWNQDWDGIRVFNYNEIFEYLYSSKNKNKVEE